MENLIVISTISTISFIVFLILFLVKRKKYKSLNKDKNKIISNLKTEKDEIQKELESQKQNYETWHNKYSPIIDLEKKKSDLEEKINNLTQQESQKIKECQILSENCKNILRDISSLEEKKELYEVGRYEPHFDFSDSDQYREEVKKVVAAQKSLIKSKKAAICETNWSIGDSRTQGQAMINRNIKLTLKAFNKECDSSILQVSWRNIHTIEKRILQAAKTINNLNKTNDIIIQQPYIDLKLQELYLKYEQKEKEQEERELLKERRLIEKEEEKRKSEALKAQKEEEKYQKLLDKA